MFNSQQFLAEVIGEDMRIQKLLVTMKRTQDSTVKVSSYFNDYIRAGQEFENLSEDTKLQTDVRGITKEDAKLLILQLEAIAMRHRSKLEDFRFFLLANYDLQCPTISEHGLNNREVSYIN